VDDVWIAGRRHLENGQFVHIDTDGLLARANEWRDRMSDTGEVQ